MHKQARFGLIHATRTQRSIFDTDESSAAGAST